MARMVATKAALSIRVDALTDADGKSEPTAPSIGIENRAKLESRLRALEHQGDLTGVRGFSTPGKKQQRFEMTGDVKTYNSKADAVGLVSTQREGGSAMDAALKAVEDVKEEKRRAKEEKKAKKRAEKEKKGVDEEGGGDDKMDVDEPKSSKKEKKKEKAKEVDDGEGKKKRKHDEEANGAAATVTVSLVYFFSILFPCSH